FSAHALWFFHERRDALPWWNPLIILISTLALNQWWQRRKVSVAGFDALLQIAYAFGAAALVLLWFEPKFSPDTWLVMLGAFSLAGLAFGAFARAWSIALAAQLFTVICIFKCFIE